MMFAAHQLIRPLGQSNNQGVLHAEHLKRVTNRYADACANT
jgi:hypothetical protein